MASRCVAELRHLLPDEGLSDAVGHLEISGIQLDSRNIEPGDLFIAVPGAAPGIAAPGAGQHNNTDGRMFIIEAIAAGAVAVIAEQTGWQEDWQEGIALDCPVPVLLIAELAKNVSAIAGRFYGEPSNHVNVIGVTGTNGKTTCTQLLAQLFNHLDVPAGVIGTLGYGMADAELSSLEMTATGLTTPDAVLGQQILADMYARGAGYVAMEVSSHGLDQGRINGIRMRGAVFTNLSRDHLDYHGAMADYFSSKKKLFAQPGLQFAVINVDDRAGVALTESLARHIKCYSYSVADSSASVFADAVSLSGHGLEADIVTPWGKARLRSRLIGEFNLSNLLAVIAVACATGLQLGDVVDAVAKLRPVAGRLEVVSDDSRPLVIVDYAHTPDALEKVLATLGPTTRNTAGSKLWCVFGCGGERDRGKRPEMGAVAERLADEVVVTSDNPRGEAPAKIISDILAGASRPFHSIEDRAEAIHFAIVHAAPADTVLIAGKGHEEYQITGDNRLPFVDAAQARLALRSRDADIGSASRRGLGDDSA
ncbi:MAG: UDP-N-acetylmuramoyl-L-alanyl-D-glutamate--2,6-diaminopimelate ligase [Gammaproteobacteria bacterium]|nr:MAG: UDP-N-acetylmuramoyl-L-alanyl-D-glutamate--2,6-diaminopimelate ligase [Gammaproteobacteria bacterium]